jgi:hypothetical protein
MMKYIVLSIIIILAMNALCSNPKHPVKSLFFCKNCAGQQKFEAAMYCEECHPEFKAIHQVHSYDKKLITSEFFETPYKNFKDDLILHLRRDFIDVYKKDHPGLSVAEYKQAFAEAVRKSNDVYKMALIDCKLNHKTEFENPEYRKWLIAHQFWVQKPSAS